MVGVREVGDYHRSSTLCVSYFLEMNGEGRPVDFCVHKIVEEYLPEYKKKKKNGGLPVDKTR